jgi:hypothetical protein
MLSKISNCLDVKTLTRDFIFVRTGKAPCTCPVKLFLQLLWACLAGTGEGEILRLFSVLTNRDSLWTLFFFKKEVA